MFNQSVMNMILSFFHENLETDFLLKFQSIFKEINYPGPDPIRQYNVSIHHDVFCLGFILKYINYVETILKKCMQPKY